MTLTTFNVNGRVFAINPALVSTVDSMAGALGWSIITMNNRTEYRVDEGVDNVVTKLKGRWDAL